MRTATTRIVRKGDVMHEHDDDAREILVTIYGEPIGRKYELADYGPRVVLGRDSEADITIEDDSVSRQHCELVSADGGWTVQDLGSTNGTYVAGRAVRQARLADGDLIKIGSTILKFLSTANVEAAYHEEIYRMAIFDGLTQIHSRRYFEEFTDREISRCKRHGRDLSLLLFDVDHFKNINDTHGHLTGDHVLRTIAARVSARIRREELFARYAGDEFVVVLPESNAAEAMHFGRLLVELVGNETMDFDGATVPVTISLGVGSLQEGIDTPTQLVRAADKALYRAKDAGRNQASV